MTTKPDTHPTGYYAYAPCGRKIRLIWSDRSTGARVDYWLEERFPNSDYGASKASARVAELNCTAPIVPPRQSDLILPVAS